MKKQTTPLQTLIDCGRQFYERRWMWGTAGNLSLRLRSDPLTIAITPSGFNKGHLRTQDFITVKDAPLPSPSGAGTTKSGLIPSSETAIHQAVYRARLEVHAVFHVHPIYSTLISKFYGHPTQTRRLKVEWFEMMKGIGVGDEKSSEITILPNWQDPSRIAGDLTQYLKNSPKALPAVLIYNHGLTGWGKTAEEARNYLEIMEYVCQYLYLKSRQRAS